MDFLLKIFYFLKAFYFFFRIYVSYVFETIESHFRHNGRIGHEFFFSLDS